MVDTAQHCAVKTLQLFQQSESVESKSSLHTFNEYFIGYIKHPFISHHILLCLLCIIELANYFSYKVNIHASSSH